ncbi:MAG TPA: 2-oxo acid dehydrogenase subunit E2 [Bacteroidales bacterium]|nr:2-oxo acid dehydrogenase subunit E2 [Bacteroidales bacterium]HPR12218.1 2-oxo acid dehydrogenase subunit E2 [Bacteroidales bacterium]HRW85848.1 2-oxo acid dehydrogenase subunit E2 [Bacteroidales bacterium]
MPVFSRRHNQIFYKSNDPEIGQYTIKKLSFFRRISIDTFDALAPSPYMLALMEFDVTDARRKIRQKKRNGSPVSFQSFIVKAIASAVDEFKELNSIISGKRLFIFEDIDINIPLELNTDGEKFPRQIIIRKADRKSAEDIFKEIEAARSRFIQYRTTGDEDKWANNMMRILFVFPKFLRKILIREVVNKPLIVKKRSGTVHFTTVAGFSQTSGYVIPCMIGVRSLDFTLGSIQKKTAGFGNETLSRDILSITVMFNHKIVDGVPAALFSNRLKQIIENGDFI